MQVASIQRTLPRSFRNEYEGSDKATTVDLRDLVLRRGFYAPRRIHWRGFGMMSKSWHSGALLSRYLEPIYLNNSYSNRETLSYRKAIPQPTGSSNEGASRWSSLSLQTEK